MDKPDIYSKLLGIPPGPRPPDFYRLLGLPLYEPSAERIHEAARQLIAKLAPKLSGKRMAAVQKLMGEIATARAALTTPQVKQRYDAKLRERLPGDTSSPSLLPSEMADLPPPAIDPAQLQQTISIGRMELDDDVPLPAPAKSPRWARQVDNSPPPPPPRPGVPPLVVKAKLVAGPGAAFADQFPRPAPTMPTPLPSPFFSSPTLMPQPPGDPAYDALPPTASEHSFLPPPARQAVTPWPEAMSPAPSGLADMVASAATSRRVTSGKPKKSSQAAVVVALLCLVAVVGAAAGTALVMQSRSPARATAEDASKAPDKHSPVAAQTGSTRASAKSPGAKALAEKRTAAMPPPGEQPAAERDWNKETANIRPSLPAKEEMANEPAAPPAEMMAKPDAAAKMPMTDKAAEKMPAMPAAADADPAQATLVRGALKKAREELTLRHLDAAQEQLDLAALDATSDSLMLEVERERTLRHFVDRFWNAVRESTETLEPLSEFKVGNDLVIVVDITPDREKLTLKSKGTVGTPSTIEQLPTEIAVAIAERWLDPIDKNSKAFVGAFLVLDGRGDPKLGRRMLEEAKAGGSDAAETVLAELDRK